MPVNLGTSLNQPRLIELFPWARVILFLRSRPTKRRPQLALSKGRTTNCSALVGPGNATGNSTVSDDLTIRNEGGHMVRISEAGLKAIEKTAAAGCSEATIAKALRIAR